MPGRRLIAGSIGSYGAILADRSEYTGGYWDNAQDRQKAEREHRLRLAVLAKAGVDIIAVETLPGTGEADVIIDLLQSPCSNNVPFYVSFVTHDGICTPRGENIVNFLSECFHIENGKYKTHQPFAVGINCSSIESITKFVTEFCKFRNEKYIDHLRLILYPNADEIMVFANFEERLNFWRALCQKWISLAGVDKIAAIGGCCNVLVEDIKAIATVLHE